MRTIQVVGHAPRVTELSRCVAGAGACLGCADCRGLCAALIEALTVPDAVLQRGAR